MQKKVQYSDIQIWVLVALRISIGWHFLYEGLSKLLNPHWSAFPYLMDAQGFLSSFFKMLASGSGLEVVNSLNEWGLTLIGLGLILGLFTRLSIGSGILLLFMYYLSHPALLGSASALPSEGSYFLVDKNIIEIIALLVLMVFPTQNWVGFDSILFKNKKV